VNKIEKYNTLFFALRNKIKKHFMKCPDCNKHLQYWKPFSKKDTESWYCKHCPNLFHERGKDIGV
jgi:uncharacterized protein with PIN domain